MLISSDFLASDYCAGYEMQRAMERHDAGEARVIPVLLRPVANWQETRFGKLQVLPSNGKPVTSWLDPDDAFVDIAEGIRAVLQSEKLLIAKVSSSMLPSIWNVPYPRNALFTGQDELLASLSTALKTGQAAALSQAHAISGLGGIGKTQIALEYAYRYARDYQAVFWTLADKRESLISGYIGIAGLLHLPEKEAREQEITIAAVKTWLQTHDSWLLILDNADDLRMVREFVPPSFGGHILLTTRAQSMGRLAKRVEVDTMGQEIGALFLLRRVGLIAEHAPLDKASPPDSASAREICTELGGLPLALDQAGAFIENTQCSLTEYLQLYRTQRAELLRERGGLVDDHREGVSTTWSISFANVEQKSPAAADLLRLLAFLAPDAIPEEMITEGAEHLGPYLQELGSNPLLLKRAIAELLAYSLIRRDRETKTLSIHRLVQAVLKDGMDDETRKLWAERAVRSVNAVFPDVEFKVWPQCERYLPHALVGVDLIEQEPIERLEAAALLYKAGWYLDDRARYREAERFYRGALALREQLLGGTHPDTATTLHNLAALYQEQGKYEQAEPLFQRGLGIYEQALGGTHPHTAATLNQLASLYLEQGKYEQAEQLYLRALGIKEQALGGTHPDTATTLHSLATLYQEQGKYEQAEQMYQRALGIYEQALGGTHPYTAATLNQLASLYLEQGKYEQAEQLYQRALGIKEQALGGTHPSTATTLHSLAVLYQDKGKYEQAEPLYQRALMIREQTLGETHPRTQNTLRMYASLLRVLKRDAEAEALESRIHEQSS